MPRALLLNKCTGIREKKTSMSKEYIQVILLDCKGTEYCCLWILCIAENSSRVYAILVFIWDGLFWVGIGAPPHYIRNVLKH